MLEIEQSQAKTYQKEGPSGGAYHGREMLYLQVWREDKLSRCFMVAGCLRKTLLLPKWCVTA